MHKAARKIWNRNDLNPITGFTGIKYIEFKHLESVIRNNEITIFEELVSELASGKFLIIKNCFTTEEVEFIKDYGRRLMVTTKSTHYKMNDLIPDFWRDITEEHSAKYGVPVIKKSMFFFPWNDNEAIFSLINRRWRLIKLLCGVDCTLTENTTPADGVVDRIQIVSYPAGSGYLEAHQDPDHNQRVFISGYLSKKGVDFERGGFWAANYNNEKICMEDFIETGDMGIAYARIIHGVDIIEGDSGSERWFLGLYTNDSDLKWNRKTLSAPKIDIKSNR